MAKKKNGKLEAAGRRLIESAANETYEFRGETYSVHPVAHLFPRMKPEDFDQFCKHIAVTGTMSPIVLDGKTIIDGRSRLLAAIELGLDDVPFVQLPEGEKAGAFITNANSKRGDLNSSQRAVIGSNLKALYAVAAADRAAASSAQAESSAADSADLSGIESPTSSGGAGDESGDP